MPHLLKQAAQCTSLETSAIMASISQNPLSCRVYRKVRSRSGINLIFVCLVVCKMQGQRIAGALESGATLCCCC